MRALSESMERYLQLTKIVLDVGGIDPYCHDDTDKPRSSIMEVPALNDGRLTGKIPPTSVTNRTSASKQLQGTISRKKASLVRTCIATEGTTHQHDDLLKL
jgi:hypothetical protein